MYTLFRFFTILCTFAGLLVPAAVPANAQPVLDTPPASWISSPITYIQVKAFNCDSVTEIPKTECLALVSLYDSTNGSGWFNNTNWLQTNTPGTWYGVTVFSDHVTEIYLDYNNNLAGSLPPALGDLTFLERLTITGNSGLAGTGLPAELGTLTNLQILQLGENELGGTIPSTFQNLSNLQELALPYNQLTGSIPSWLGNLTQLETLDLVFNQLTGPLPVELGSLANLKNLFLGNNPIGGSIPTWLGGMTRLERVGLFGNQFSGTIPSELSSLTSLIYLGLGDNLLTGELPAWLGDLTSLVSLLLEDNQLSGTIPTEIGSLTGLQFLNLSQNQLSGPVPSSLQNLVSLNTYMSNYGLDLGYNRLTVPASPESLATFLASKDPDWHLTQAATTQVTPQDGGTLLSNDGAASLVFPPNSLPATMTVAYLPLPNPSQEIPEDQAFAGLSYRLQFLIYKAPGDTFDQPANMTIHYSEEALRGHMDASGWMFAIPEDSLVLVFRNGSLWIDATAACPAPGVYVRDPDSNSFTVPVCTIGEYALTGAREYSIYLPDILR